MLRNRNFTTNLCKLVVHIQNTQQWLGNTGSQISAADINFQLIMKTCHKNHCCWQFIAHFPNHYWVHLASVYKSTSTVTYQNITLHSVCKVLVCCGCTDKMHHCIPDKMTMRKRNKLILKFNCKFTFKCLIIN
jgi:hypothetical protein